MSIGSRWGFFHVLAVTGWQPCRRSGLPSEGLCL